MSEQIEHRFIRLISGQWRGLTAGAARAALGLIEPVYSTAMRLRNRLFDHGIWRVRSLPRPVISVGNLTTGGTGKTPIVQWLVEQLLGDGLRPAILTRGYRKSGSTGSDEAEMLRAALGPSVPLGIDRNRHAAGLRLLNQTGGAVDLFILDDGFQHRHLARDFDLVLVDATSPFGFDHVLPRGLLREPITGLRRASAVLITRVNLVSDTQVDGIAIRIGALAPGMPVFRARHELGRVDGAPDDVLESGAPVLALSAIANPDAFAQTLRSAGINVAQRLSFGDHHTYTADDLVRAQTQVQQHGLRAIVTTAKDWVKLARLQPPGPVPLCVAELRITFTGDDEARLLESIRGALARSRA